ncbi:hypothetical protein GCM10027395_23380 [Giesbergeria sinuosa]
MSTKNLAPKTVATPKDASRVQSATAKVGDGKPTPWAGNLQRAAAKNFGKSGQK